MQDLKFLCINVCGLLARLRCPEFVELLQGYDIIGIQESKTDDTVNIYLPGYTYTAHNRCKMARIKSGGIGLFVKDTFSSYINIDKAKCSKLVLWFTINRYITTCNENINVGIVFHHIILNTLLKNPILSYNTTLKDIVKTQTMLY